MSESGFITLLSGSNVHIYSSELLCLLPPLLNTSFLQQFLNQRRKKHSKSWRDIPLLRHPSNCNISPKHQLYTFLNLPSSSSLTINSLRVFFCFFVFLLFFFVVVVFNIYCKSQIIRAPSCHYSSWTVTPSCIFFLAYVSLPSSFHSLTHSISKP